MKPHPRVKKLAIAATATVLAMATCELVLRLFFDVQVIPFLRVYDPDTGTRYKKNLSVEIHSGEFTMKFSTDSRGFREPEPPPSLDGCILIFGDSYSEGWGVNDGQEYPSLLRDALDARYGPGAVPVVNAAMSASGNGRWLKLLRGELANSKPRLVLFQACWNDSRDNVREKLYGLNEFHSIDSGELSDIFTVTDQSMPLSRRLQPLLEAIPGLESSHLFALFHSMFHETAPRLSWDLSADVPDAEIRTESAPPEAEGRPWLFGGDRLFMALIQHCLATCHDRGWPSALMSVRIGGPRLEEIRKVAAHFGAPFIDIRNRVAHPELYYEIDSHWNAAGHRWVANLLLERLLSEDSPYLRGL